MKPLIAFLTSKTFLRQLFYMFLVAATVLFAVVMWLRVYTNHGQKLEMPSYIDQHVDEASADAADKTFSIIVTDSVHYIGRPGGEIIDQNPPAGAFVKENRKVYVRTTKYNPDLISSGDLPVLYGNNFEQKRRELNQRGLNVKVKDYKYDSGEPDHILQVWYDDKILFDKNINRRDVKIERGGSLEVVLSKRSGGSTPIPDLRCKTLAEARFFLEQAKLRVGGIDYPADVANVESAFVVSQSPSFEIGSSIEMGTAIDVIVASEKPAACQ
jgi:beta-lactam-binding protein with PASTA domain